MYRTYELTDAEKGKIIRSRWDGDTYYYDVFETQEECDLEQKRLDRIEAEYKEAMLNYRKRLEENDMKKYRNYQGDKNNIR